MIRTNFVQFKRVILSSWCTLPTSKLIHHFSELEGLVKFIRPFMLLVSKAKAAKMVRELLDLFLDMEVSTGTEVFLK